MKNYIIVLLSAIFGVLMCSCNDDDSTQHFENCPPLYVGYFISGGDIYDANLYCLNNLESNGMPTDEFFDLTKYVKDYDDFKLCIRLKYDTIPSLGNQYAQHQYETKNYSFYIEALDNYRKTNNSCQPKIATAYINGEVSITCDKTLFGEAPGTNLSKYFTVYDTCPCIIIGRENPKFLYNFGEELPKDMQSFFANDTWLQHSYWLEFTEHPSEKYDNLTFYMTLPMIRQHSREYYDSIELGHEEEMQYSEIVFTGECHLVFNWVYPY